MVRGTATITNQYDMEMPLIIDNRLLVSRLPGGYCNSQIGGVPRYLPWFPTLGFHSKFWLQLETPTEDFRIDHGLI
jgi:hypothetical protein